MTISGQKLQLFRLWPILISAVVLSLHFFNSTFLSVNSKVGTLYLLVPLTLVSGCIFFWKSRSLWFSKFFWGAFLVWVLTGLGALQAFNKFWALIWVGVFGVYLLFLLIITNYSHNRRDFASKFVDLLMAAGLVAALLGLYEYVYFHCVGPTRTALIPSVLPPDFEGRVAGFYGQPNLFALFLTLAILACYYRYLHDPDLDRYTSTWGKALRFLPFFVIALTFFLTRSKGGFISLGCISLLLLWLTLSGRYLSGHNQQKKEGLFLILFLVVAFLLSKVSLQVGVEEVVATRSLANVAETSSGRFVFWMSAFLIFLDNPWLGIGLDNYRFVMNSYGPKSHDYLGFVEYEAMKSAFWAHNELLQMLAEGGFFLFVVLLFGLAVFFYKSWNSFVRPQQIKNPFFLYSHLFLAPFIIQAQFSWPLRHPALLLLFMVFLGILVSQYPLKEIQMGIVLRSVLVVFFSLGLLTVGILYLQEKRIVDFKNSFLTKPPEVTVKELSLLAKHPYTSYRVLHNTLPIYTEVAFSSDNHLFAEELVPLSERLVNLVGRGDQWYDLARLYYKVGRLDDARYAINQAFELKPTNVVIFNFLHHLNVLQAVQETGKPIKSFYPPWIDTDELFFPGVRE